LDGCSSICPEEGAAFVQQLAPGLAIILNPMGRKDL